MRCICCDKELSDKEVTWNEELGDWELCTVCFDVAMDAAYCDGFQMEEDSSFVILDNDFIYGDSGDVVPSPSWEADDDQ